MWCAIVATTVHFRPLIGNLALVLLGPYLVWVSYACALTLWIWGNNPPTSTKVGLGRVVGAAACLHTRARVVARPACAATPAGE